jgi:hypothetical protein
MGTAAGTATESGWKYGSRGAQRSKSMGRDNATGMFSLRYYRILIFEAPDKHLFETETKPAGSVQRTSNLDANPHRAHEEDRPLHTPPRELILNYFRAQKLIPSSVVEGLNNKANFTMKKSYGFRTYRVLELALYHSLGKLPEPKSTHDSLLLTR